MIKPLLADDELLEDIRAADATGGHFHLWWLGQSGFLVKYQNQHLLFDPYLSDSLTRKYAETDKPHVRMTELAIDPRHLDFIDVVTSSHNHTDHLDGETLRALMDANEGREPTALAAGDATRKTDSTEPAASAVGSDVASSLTIIVPAANRDFAADRLRVDPQRLTVVDDGQSVEAGGYKIHAVPAAHEEIERDEDGRCKFLGYVAQFGPWTVYHSGDTVLYDGMVERLRNWRIDLALLPINGSRPERRGPGNLWGHEAVQLAKDIGARMVIPCHFEMFEFNTVTPDEFIEFAEKLAQPHQVLRCNQRWSSSEL